MRGGHLVAVLLCTAQAYVLAAMLPVCAEEPAPTNPAVPSPAPSPTPAPSAIPAGRPGGTAEAAPPVSATDPVVALIRTKLYDPRVSKGTSADDLAVLDAFYRTRTGGPLWMTQMGFSAKGQSALFEIGKADDWGLDATAFDLPPAGALPASPEAQAMAEFNRAEARLKEIGVPSQPKDGSRLLTITAPMTGSVITLTTASGSFANDMTASLMTIANLDSVWVTASVPEIDMAFIAKGQSVDVFFPAYLGQVFHGKVAFVSEVVEPDTRRNKVRISFTNPDGKFKPNMFATASFNIPQKSAVFVPNSALLMDNDSTMVFVEVAPWTFVKRPVLPGYGEGDGTRIDLGLNPEDRIIVKGGVLLND